MSDPKDIYENRNQDDSCSCANHDAYNHTACDMIGTAGGGRVGSKGHFDQESISMSVLIELRKTETES